MSNGSRETRYDEDDLAARFKSGMRRLASGVSIVATRDGEGFKGFVATSVSSVSMEPSPSLLVCVNRSASSHDALLETGVFSVNLLAEGDVDTARRFGSAIARYERFEDGQWIDRASGAPLYRRALASFGCAVSASLVVGTHTVLVGRVVSVAGLEGTLPSPLLYYAGGFASVREA